MTSIADRTRKALLDRPYLLEAMAAGTLNLAATARHLDIEGADPDAVAAALRRFDRDRAAPVGTDRPRVRISDGADLPDIAERWSDQLQTVEAEGSIVCIEAEEIDLAHHRAAIGRLLARNLVPVATTLIDDTAYYAIDADAIGQAVRAIERPTDVAVHSSAGRENPG